MLVLVMVVVMVVEAVVVVRCLQVAGPNMKALQCIITQEQNLGDSEAIHELWK